MFFQKKAALFRQPLILGIDHLIFIFLQTFEFSVRGSQFMKLILNNLTAFRTKVTTVQRIFKSFDRGAFTEKDVFQGCFAFIERQ